MRSAVLTERATVPYAVLLVLFFGLTLALETSFIAPLKLTGHRAFPGAFMLLLAAEGLAPVMLVALAAVVPAVLAALGYMNPLGVAVYMITALGLAMWYRKQIFRGPAGFIIVGLGYGLLLYLSKSFGLHHTPELARLGGHMAFGAAAGLGAYAATRATRRSES